VKAKKPQQSTANNNKYINHLTVLPCYQLLPFITLFYKQLHHKFTMNYNAAVGLEGLSPI
jgi:hypothetical protein